MAYEKAKQEANVGMTRLRVQELESLPDASNHSLYDGEVSSMQAAAQARTNTLISLASELGATVEDKRGNGGRVSVRLPAQRDVRSIRLAREFFGAGFKPYPGQVFAK